MTDDEDEERRRRIIIRGALAAVGMLVLYGGYRLMFG